MLQELKFQLSTAILTILTVAAAISAGVNFEQQLQFRLPDDGVTWVDRTAPAAGISVVARRVVEGSGAANAGIRAGDILRKINGLPIKNALYVPQALVKIGVWNKADYLVERSGVQFKSSVIVQAVPRDPAVMYLYAVGVGYLMIGLFVYFRRGAAQRARHFYIFCLVSFIFCAFHYTGALSGFDSVILFGNVAAGLLAPTLFLHFCLTFPEPRGWLRGGVWRVVLLYLPAAALMLLYVGFSSGSVRVDRPLVEAREFLDRIWLVFLTAMYLIGAAALSVEHKRTDDPIVRQQLKWLRNGAFCGILPFAIFYVLPYMLGVVPNAYMKLSVLGLALVPLTLAYAIIRYRLMDVDILFRRGYAYTLATLCVLAGFYAIVFSLASLVQKNFKDLGQGGIVAIMLLAAFLFQPVRNWIQERLDRYFYRDRYDYRQKMVEFARELSSETDLDTMLSEVAERLRHTLYIRHLAFFLSEDIPEESPEKSAARFYLKRGVGLRDRNGRAIGPGDPLDLNFLDQAASVGGEETPYLFFGRTRYMVDAVSRAMPPSERHTISDLDLTYYIPCSVRGRTIAFLGVSRTEDGDFLSSVDVELLQTLSGYVGIAIENARLYRSLQRKVEENERLKEFSENIVESINVGILAVDLEDRVESWNTQVEQLTGIPRDKAVGRTLAELLPAEIVERFTRVRGESGIHHIYKFILRPAAMPGMYVDGSNGHNGHGPRAPRESTLNIAIAPLISKNMEQIGRLIIFDDVTDRAELERRLVQADKLSSIGLLAAGVAHEVNTPLAVISTYAQMLAKQVAEDEQKSKLLEKIAKQTFRASEIVNSLLNFSRTSTTEFGEVSINRVIQETLSLLDHQMKKAGLEVCTDLDDGAPVITGNPGKLQQVFLNLFLNARDAMVPGGKLEVKTSHDEDGVRIDVSDTGHGIDPENILRIYDPFFTTKGAKKGTGLGLSVTYGIIQEHGGAIKVFSRPGEGARFHLEFPSAEAKSRKPATV